MPAVNPRASRWTSSAARVMPANRARKTRLARLSPRHRGRTRARASNGKKARSSAAIRTPGSPRKGARRVASQSPKRAASLAPGGGWHPGPVAHRRQQEAGDHGPDVAEEHLVGMPGGPEVVARRGQDAGQQGEPGPHEGQGRDPGTQEEGAKAQGKGAQASTRRVEINGQLGLGHGCVLGGMDMGQTDGPVPSVLALGARETGEAVALLRRATTGGDLPDGNHGEGCSPPGPEYRERRRGSLPPGQGVEALTAVNRGTGPRPATCGTPSSGPFRCPPGPSRSDCRHVGRSASGRRCLP